MQPTKMAGVGKGYPLKALYSSFRILFLRLWSRPSLKSKVNNTHAARLTSQKYSLFTHNIKDLAKETLVFDLEGALLKSPSLFPYFMLVAFEAGGPLRALIMLLLYPFVRLVGKELGLKIMVFISFVGIRKDGFRIGTAVLPKFLLEDVGCEWFDVVMSSGKKIGLSDLPRIVVEGFLKDYLGVEAAVGTELKVVYGYYVGLMEEKKAGWDILIDQKKMDYRAVAIGCFSESLHHQLILHCKEVHLVNKAEKRNWQTLPREKYPKPLVFHDCRLAFRPTPFATLALFMWLPLGLFLSIFRIIVGRLLPYKMSSPILAFTGTRTTTSKANLSYTSTEDKGKPTGILYSCNHRTLLDPLYISLALMKPVAAVTYSLSRLNELISPIKTVRLTRDRERDRKLMESMLSQSDLVICPEGTTCREPYLLRFSPLFAEMTDEIVPVAIDVQISMFYGSTASGLKCLDPVFHFLNPHPTYVIKILQKLPSSHTSNLGGTSKLEVANHVQNKIAKALGFECTNLTRKDKSMILSGNDGII